MAPSNLRSVTMKRMITVLATALLASSLLAGAADARGGGGGHMGGGFGGEHMGGLGGGHIGSGGHIGAHGYGLHQHALHRFGGYGPGYGYYPDCYDWYELHPDQPLPLSCS